MCSKIPQYTEPEWMQKARTVPLVSDPASRMEHSRLRVGQKRNGNHGCITINHKEKHNA